jgi:hypothetical protein
VGDRSGAFDRLLGTLKGLFPLYQPNSEPEFPLAVSYQTTDERKKDQ